MDQLARGEIAEGRYVLVRPIASGGMGRIWEGRDTRLDRTVAVKEVSLDLVPPVRRAEFIERAVNEGRHAAALADHPNIVTVYDVVVEDGAPWTVMQFVRGRSLAEALKAGPMPVEATAALARQMLSALALVHGTGILHRDVKPHNILLNDSDGRALLTDFGIAKGSGDVSLTQSGLVVGSTPYMAPERHEGEADGPASDLFSLGVTLFEAVEGYSPFAKDSRTGTVTAILVKPLPAMRRAGRLEPLIKALTDKDAARRPSAEQALLVLEQAADQPAASAAPPVSRPAVTLLSAPPDEPRVIPAGPAVTLTAPTFPSRTQGGTRAFRRPQTTGAPAPVAGAARFPPRHWISVGLAAAVFLVATLLPIASEYRSVKKTGVRTDSEKLSFDFSAPWLGRVTGGTNWDPGFRVAAGVLIVGTAAVLVIAALWPLLAARKGLGTVQVLLGIAIALYTFMIVFMTGAILVASHNGSEDDTDIVGDIDRIVLRPGGWLLLAALAWALTITVRAMRFKPQPAAA